MIFIEKSTNQRVVRAKHSGDIVFEASSPSKTNALDNETEAVIGPWENNTPKNESEKGGPNSRNLQLGIPPNRFGGTLAGLHGARLGNLNEVGEPADFTRREKRFIRRDF